MTTGAAGCIGHTPVVSVSSLPPAEDLHSVVLCVATLGISKGLRFDTPEDVARYACKALGLSTAQLNEKFGPRGLTTL